MIFSRFCLRASVIRAGVLCATDLEKPTHNTSFPHPLHPMAGDGESRQGVRRWGVGVAKQPVVTLTRSENRNLVSGWNIRPDPKPSIIPSKVKAVLYKCCHYKAFCSSHANIQRHHTAGVHKPQLIKTSDPKKVCLNKEILSFHYSSNIQ